MTIRLSMGIGAGISLPWIWVDDGLGVGPVQRVAELDETGLQGVETLGKDGGQWGWEGGGGGRRGKGLALRVCLAVGKS